MKNQRSQKYGKHGCEPVPKRGKMRSGNWQLTAKNDDKFSQTRFGSGSDNFKYSITDPYLDQQNIWILLRTQEISVALLINPRNVGGEIRKTFVIKCAN